MLDRRTVQTRRIGPDDWRVWRELRLQALAEAPYAFGSVLADWQGAGDREARWRERLDPDGFAAYSVVGRLDADDVGLASGTALEQDGSIELISMWVAPAARGHGVGDALVAAVVADARRRGAVAVTLWVTAGNHRAVQLYRRCGFELTGASQPFDGGRRELAMSRRIDVPD